MKSKLAVAAAIAFAGAAGGAYVLWPKSPAHRIGCAVPLSAAGAAAVARDGAGIELQVVRMPDGSRNVTFADHRRHEELLRAYGPRGKLLEADLTVRRRGGGVETQVSYTDRTWMVFRNTQLPFLTSAPAAESAAYRLDLGLPGTTILGRVRLDGRDTLHVVRVEHTRRRRVTHPPAVRRSLPKGIHLPVEYIPAMTTRTEAWLDPLTYLPARVRTGDGRGHYSVTDERWLPRTAATLSRLRLRIPHAFRRLPVQQNGVDAWFTTLAVKRACAQS